MHHLHNELGGGTRLRVNVRLAFFHGRHNVGRMVRLVVNSRARRLEVFSPASLVFELAVERFPALGLLFAVKQRKLGALDDGHVSAPGNLQHAERVQRLFFHPLIAADGGDTEHVKLLRLQEDQQRLLIAGAGAAGVLIDYYFYFLGGGGCEQKSEERHQRGFPRAASLHFGISPAEYCIGRLRADRTESGVNQTVCPK